MDRGEMFKREFRVMPGEDGSFVVMVGGPDRGAIGSTWGFPKVGDLIVFLTDHAAALVEAQPARDGKST